MKTQQFLIGGERYEANDPRLQPALGLVYQTSRRPVCLCIPNGVPMYVSKFRQFVVKRMPDTGSEHQPSCPSYEPPASEPGLGAMLEERVIGKSRDQVEVHVDFPFTRYDAHSDERRESSNPRSVRRVRGRLGVSGLTDLLIERAEFSRWHPNMEHKRNWNVFRWHVLRAAGEIEVQGAALAERLFLPEPFIPNDADGIRARREEFFARTIARPGAAARRLNLVMGELIAATTAPYGQRWLLKHMKDCPLWVSEPLGTRLRSRFADEFHAFQAQLGARLLVSCTVYVTEKNHYIVDTAGVRLTTWNWIPVDNVFEKTVAEALTQQRRRFRKPLRVEALSAAALPNFLLLDVGNEPILMDILARTAPPWERAAKEKAVESRAAGSWVWRVGERLAPPPFPPPSAPRSLGRSDNRNKGSASNAASLDKLSTVSVDNFPCGAIEGTVEP